MFQPNHFAKKLSKQKDTIVVVLIYDKLMGKVIRQAKSTIAILIPIFI